MYNTAFLAWGLCFCFFVGLSSTGLWWFVTFCFIQKGKSERFLLEMTLLVFLESCSSSLWAFRKLLFA